MTAQIETPLLPFSRGATVENSLAYMGSILSFLVDAADTGGGLSILQVYGRRGSEPPPHVHLREHEIFYILAGEIEYFCEGREGSLLVRAGELVFLPRHKAHAFYFRSPEVRLLTILHDPDVRVLADTFFRKMALGPASSMDLPDVATQYATADTVEIERAFALAAEHGIVLLTPEETERRLPHYPGFGTNLGLDGG